MYIDDFVRDQGFESTEKYVKHCYQNHMPLWLKGPRYFTGLFIAEVIRPFTGLRIFYVSGGQDASYMITEEGKLEGISHIPCHRGLEGIYEPEELLSNENAPDGWSVDLFFPKHS